MINCLMLRRAQIQPPADRLKAEQSMEMAQQVDSKERAEKVIEKYGVIMKLAGKDQLRWKNFYRTGSPKGFIEDVSQYTEDDWKAISEKLDKVIEELDTVVVG